MSRNVFISSSVRAATAGALRSPVNRSTATVSAGTCTSRTVSSSGVGSVSIDHFDGMKNRTVQPCSALPVWATGAVIAMSSPPERACPTGAVIAISASRWFPPKM